MSLSAFICSPKRSAVGSFQGRLASLPAAEIASKIVSAIVLELGLPLDSIEDVTLGCVLTAGMGQAPARQAALAAGLPNSVHAATINKVCSSGLYSVMLAARSITSGEISSAIAGGMESMSNAPYIMPKLRSGARLGHVEALDVIVKDGLWDVYNNFHMGSAAELCAKKFEISREMQDDFARLSYTRALEAQQAGYFKEEIVPIKIKDGKEEIEFSTDEEPGRGKLDKFASLKPAFETDGTVTAANASSLNDGAAAMLVCSEKFMKDHGLKPMARIVASAEFSQAPEWFTTAPVGAVNALLKKTGKKAAEVDLYEINEAFSCVALACNREIGISVEKANISGGAVAIGHPIGASGARILTTLLHNLKRTGGRIGIAGICNGGGEATALMVEMC
jgi:acetyl-CoA C-acetyltransferase